MYIYFCTNTCVHKPIIIISYCFGSFISWNLLYHSIPRVKHFVKSSISHGLSRYKHVCVLQVLQKIRKLKMSTIFDKITIFFFGKLVWLPSRDSLRANNFVIIALSHTLFKIQAFFCVLQFLQKIRKYKMAAIFGETKFFGKLGWLYRRATPWIKNFVEIDLSSTVFEI